VNRRLIWTRSRFFFGLEFGVLIGVLEENGRFPIALFFLKQCGDGECGGVEGGIETCSSLSSVSLPLSSFPTAVNLKGKA